ncbi:hypothetical protein MD484_g2474, partial [Candolleomyces efflorescens]
MDSQPRPPLPLPHRPLQVIPLPPSPILVVFISTIDTTNPTPVVVVSENELLLVFAVV